ncbi:hypothetical protein [Phenylobacterium sp.]|jgi:hypothetical protein|uniref:hypothetical protein n=1 Tax=Phenylobacterium sp. TaxID=1871053 RepID=UPI002F95BA71
MPDKHPNTVRWGGPGASHEDRTKPMPPKPPAQPEGAASTNPRVSQSSGGGGERDEKHSHVDALRSSKSHTTGTPSPTSSKDWRPNRSQHDREADMAAREAVGEPRSFRNGAPEDAGSPDAPDAGHGTPVRVTYEGDLDDAAGVSGEAEQRVRRAIARFDRDLSEVQIFLSDQTPVGSPGAKTCTIQAMPHRGDTVAVTESAGELDKAVMAASRELAQRLSDMLGYGGGKPDAAGEAAPQA